MAAVTQQDWHAEAVELRAQGVSERQIAAAVGKAPSTVHDFLASVEPNGHGDPAAIPGQLDLTGREVPVESIYVEEIRVDGTTQVAFDVGGKVATSCKLALSGSAEVDGFFRKGERLRGTFEAVIVSGTVKDKIDKQTGIVTEAGQSHSARIVDFTVDG